MKNSDPCKISCDLAQGIRDALADANRLLDDLEIEVDDINHRRRCRQLKTRTSNLRKRMVDALEMVQS